MTTDVNTARDRARQQDPLRSRSFLGASTASLGFRATVYRAWIADAKSGAEPHRDGVLLQLLERALEAIDRELERRAQRAVSRARGTPMQRGAAVSLPQPVTPMVPPAVWHRSAALGGWERRFRRAMERDSQ